MKTFCLFVCVLAAGICRAQTILKFGATGGPAGAGTRKGAGADIAAKTFTFTDAGTNALAIPPTTVTFSLSNQQFGPGSVQGIPVANAVSFGNASNTLVDTQFTSVQYYRRLDNIGSSADSMFTPCYSCTAGSGAMATNSYGVYLCNTTDAFINDTGANTQALNARVYMADLTISFSRPVNNPVLQLSGLGGNHYFFSGGKTYTQGFAAEFDLVTPGLSLSRLSGNAVLSVGATSISNSATLIAGSAQGNNGSVTNGPLRYAASGSVAITGTNITSVTFKVYTRGDGGLVTNDATGAVTTANAGLGPIWAASPLSSSYAGSTVSTDNYIVGISLEKDAVVLPVNLKSFESSKINNCATQLTWETGHETNAAYFDIQESKDGLVFKHIGKVNAQNLTTGSHYQFTDDGGSDAAHYYRLLMVDLDGHTDYSNIIKSDGCLNGEAINIYPNPVEDKLNIEGLTGDVTIGLSNVTGQSLYTLKTSNRKAIIEVEDLSPGIYFITITNASGTILRTKFIKN